ncbi:hypothetical protein IGJ00_003001 [Enterococcus sp. AZ062]
MIIAQTDKDFLAKVAQAIHIFIVSYFIYFVSLQKDTRNPKEEVLSFDQYTCFIIHFTTFYNYTFYIKNFS